jgi:hypothetical protein
MVPESQNYDLSMPSPPKPKRRGPLEFYEWVALILFLLSFAVAIAIHVQLGPGISPSIREDTATLTYIDAIAAFIFLLLVVFDAHACRRYRMYSDELLTQWKDDKIRFMKLYSKDMERRTGDGKETESKDKK